jgi:hypothetical protein
MQKHIGKTAAKLVNAPLKVGNADAKLSRKATDAQRFKHEQSPEKFTYALAAHTAERRKDGWYVAKSVPTFSGEKSKWTGPFDDIENACLSIARQLFTELADRHTRSVEIHALARTDPLFGLKPTTRLRAR